MRRNGYRTVRFFRATAVAIEAMEGRTLLSAGDPDPTFGHGGIVLDREPAIGSATAVAVDPNDGKVLALGGPALEEFTATGLLNPSFGTGGVLKPIIPASIGKFSSIIEFQSGSGHGRQLLFQPDGKIVLAGTVTSGSEPNGALALFRLNANGSMDNTFGAGGIARFPATLTQPQFFTTFSEMPNGQFVVAGRIDNSLSHKASPATVYRFNANGTFDISFGSNGEADVSVGDGAIFTSLSADASGRILALGETVIRPQPVVVETFALLARLTSAGKLDTSFNGSGYVSTQLDGQPTSWNLAAAPQSNGTILTVGEVAVPNVGIITHHLVLDRYKANGSPDGAFGTNGEINTSIQIGENINDYPVYAQAQSDGKIVVGTTAFPGQFELVRFNADGSLDKTFGSGGIAKDGIGSSATSGLAIMPGGKIVITNPMLFDLTPTRFNSDGSLDTTFGINGTAIGIPHFTTGVAMAALPNGQTLAAGQVVVAGLTEVYVRRYNSNGSIDTTFAPAAGAGGASGYTFLRVPGVALQAEDDRVALKVDSAGRIIVGAQFDTATFFRLNPNGTIDTSFGANGIARITPAAYGGHVNLLRFTLDSSNRILASLSSPAFGVMRLTPNGTLDNSFGTGGVAIAHPSGADQSSTDAILTQPDGKILLGESRTTSTPGATELLVIRLNANGALDSSFGSGGAATIAPVHPTDRATVTALALLPGGKIAAAGTETVQGTTFVVAQFLSNGKPDTNFGSGGQFMNGLNPDAPQTVEITNVLAEPDGKLLLAGGYFYGGKVQDYAVERLTSAGALDFSFGTKGVVHTPMGPGHLHDAGLTANGDLEVIGNVSDGFALLRYQLGLTPGGSISLTGGTLTIDGTSGDDAITISQANGTITAKLNGVSRAFAAGDVKAIVANGNAGNDSIVVDSSITIGARLNGGAGNDSLQGGAGNDTFDGGLGNDSMSGGPGTDVVDYSSRTASLVVWLDGSHPSGQSGENDHFDGTVEIVYGGSGNDYLVGTKGNNALYGNGGNDSIFGGGGVDAFFGGAGNDQIHAKNGNKDYIDGGAGNDAAQTDLIDTVINVETVTH